MSGKNEQGFFDVKQRNVLNAPLHKHASEKDGSSSLPSSIHAGMCDSSNPVAAILTNAFLDLSFSNGTDLRKAGVGPDQRFYLEASMWKNAAEKGIGEVPKVKLESTHVKALNSVGLDVLKKWAAEPETESAQDRVLRPGEGKEKWAQKSKDIGAKDPRS